MRSTLLVYLVFSVTITKGQFSPDGGQSGSIAIHQDSVEWLGFATDIELELGWLDVADTSLGRIDFVVRDGGIGEPDLEVQPLGDGGTATATFSSPFSDQPGYDFVVFENGFATSDTTGFFELAFVEVSSNGIDFFRFPSTSLSSAEDFAGPFAELDSRLLDGLAGRFSAPYGVPFDLMDLPTDQLLNKNAITHIRMVDVIGTSDSAFAKTDSEGMAIIDPYPTAYNTGGFDLDAVGILGDNEITTTRSPRPTTVLNETVVVHPQEFLEQANTLTLWLDQLGRACHFGQFAPNIPGVYFMSTSESKTEWLRVWVQ